MQDLKRVVLAACGTRHFASSSTSNVRSDLRVELTKSKFAYCKRRALSMSEQVESVIVFGTLLPLFVLLDRRIEKNQLQKLVRRFGVVKVTRRSKGKMNNQSKS